MGLVPQEGFIPGVPDPVLAALRDAPLPCLVYHLPALREKVRDIWRAFPRYYFPVKVNPCGPVLRAVMEGGGGFNVRTLGELRDVLRLGARPQTVSFAGWGLGTTLMRRLIKAGVLVNLDSAREVRDWVGAFPGAPFGVRLMAGEDPEYLTTGFAHDEVPLMLESVRRHGGRIAGVLVHYPHLAETAERMLEDWSFLPGLLSRTLGEFLGGLEYLNLGGGWPGFYGKERPLPPEELAAAFEKGLLPALRKEGFGGELAAEPGRFAVAGCGFWAARVLDVREGKGGVREALLGTPPPVPSAAFPYPSWLFRGEKGGFREAVGAPEKVRLVGQNPLPFDTIREGALLPPPRPGDTVVLGQAGAYMRWALGYAGMIPEVCVE